MLKEYFNTLMKVIHLRSIIGYNSLVFALKKTPLIGKLLPDRLYSWIPLKVIYWIFHVIKEVLKLFAGKILGLGIIYLVSLFLKTEYLELDVGEGVSENILYACFVLLFFICYAIGGILVNTNLFRCTTEKEYLVFMLRMNARKLNNTLFAYDLAKLVAGYLIAGIIGAVCGAPFWLWLGIPVIAVFIKLFGAGAQAFSFRSKRKHNRPMKSSSFSLAMRIIAVTVMVPVLFIVIANGYYLPLWCLLIISLILVILGLWGAYQLNAFDPSLHRSALRENTVRAEKDSRSRKSDTTKQFKRIKAQGSVKGDKKGFEYLNALFVRRHRKMLIVKPVVFLLMVLTVTCLILTVFISTYYGRFGLDNTLSMVFHNLFNMVTLKGYEDPLMPLSDDSLMLFFRWVLNHNLLFMIIPVAISDNSFKATQAMYINCDNSLMTFSFFKKRDKIIRLFDIRFRQLIKINILPALSFGLFADFLLFCTGGQEYPCQYLLTLIIPAMISVDYCMMCLALYYLFQPFTTTVNVKSGAYTIARVIIAVFFMMTFWIPVHSGILAAVLAVFTVAFILLMRKLVCKYAPTTWKVKA